MCLYDGPDWDGSRVSPLTLSPPPQINYASLESKVSDMQIDYAPLLAGVDQFHVPQLTLPPDRYWGVTPACSIDLRWPIVSSLPSPFAIRKLRDGLNSWENCLDSAHASN